MSEIEGGVRAAGIEGGVAAVAVLGGVEIGGIIIEDADVPDYEGDYEVIPAETEQRLPAANRRMRRDVVVAAIPNNYGRITWDGIRLTVS